MSNRHEIYEEIAEQLRSGRPVVQATVIQTRGSTPRKEGSTMLVREDGSLVGTIGGGCGEAGVIQKARLSLLDGQAREELADLTEDIAMESEGVCGGTLRVFIEPWQPSEGALDLAQKLADLSQGDREVLVHQVIQSGEGGSGPEAEGLHLPGRVLLDAEGNVLAGNLPREMGLPHLPQKAVHKLSRTAEGEVYSERWEPVPTLVIIGAGHIAEPLDRLGREVGFRTVVVDDRRLFANRERFPKADQVVCGPILDVCREMDLSPHHYMVLVTRGHTLDMDALRVMIDRGEPLAYLGMIGSRRRIRAVFELLEKEGYPRERFEHVHAPVGLNIGAETPSEIAVSVVAEAISVRRRSGEDTRPLVRLAGRHPSVARAEREAGD